MQPGMKLHGSGFIVSPATAKALGLVRIPGLDQHIRQYLNGRDLTQTSRSQMVIDLFRLMEDAVRQCFPAVWQHLQTNVLPARSAIVDRTADAAQYARDWWLHGKPRAELRKAMAGLPRYIATVETAKHRIFTFLLSGMLPDNMLVCTASFDALVLGVLQSWFHASYALAAGGTLED